MGLHVASGSARLCDAWRQMHSLLCREVTACMWHEYSGAKSPVMPVKLMWW